MAAVWGDTLQVDRPGRAGLPRADTGRGAADSSDGAVTRQRRCGATVAETQCRAWSFIPPAGRLLLQVEQLWQRLSWDLDLDLDLGLDLDLAQLERGHLFLLLTSSF